MGCHLLKILIPAVIFAPLLWEGAQCEHSGYKLKVPPVVIVQDGLCVDIPCTFTFPPSHHNPHVKLYGYWYVEDKQRRRPQLVATNNPRRREEINARFRHRFGVSEQKLNQGDCTLTIRDAEVADKGVYHFRIEGPTHYSYSEGEERVSVTVTERELEITVLEPLRAGQRESIFCKTQICNYLSIPQFTWAHISNISVLETSRNVNHNSVEGRMDFIPTVADHQQNVICKVTYGEGSSRRTAEKTVTLNVHYPPRILPFSGHLGFNRFVDSFSNVSRVEARVGDSLLVRCEADANPPSNQTWVSSVGLPIVDNELKLSNLILTEEGEYECLAKNQEGSARATFYLRVKGLEDEQFPLGP